MEVARYAPPYFASSSLASSPFDFSLLLPSFSSPSFEVNIFQRPASSPNFSVTSCAEGEEDEDGDEVSIFSVFSLIALTLKREKLGLEGGDDEGQPPTLNPL